MSSEIVKISNMSRSIWVREATADRNKVKNTQIQNFSRVQNKDKLNENGQVMQELFLELQTALSENVKLKTENSSLKSDLLVLQTTNDNLVKAIHANKVQFEEDLNKLQDEIKTNENNLIDNNKKCLQQQKKYIEEIKELRSTKDQLTLNMTLKEEDFTNKIKKLEGEIKLVQINLKRIQTQNAENAQKSSKYKNKLKYAVIIINHLNNMLVECTTRPEVNTRETQTENESSPTHLYQDFPKLVDSTVHKHTCNLETENLILSDIFFKSKAFCDNELFFVHRDRSSTFENIN